MIAAGRVLGSFGPFFHCLAVALFAVLTAFPHGDLHERIEELSARIDHDKSNAELLLKRADLYRQHQEYSRALADIHLARSLRSDTHATYLLALVLLDSGKTSEAKAHLDEVLQKAPSHSAALVTRARTQVRLGNDAAAAADFAAAAKLIQKPDPDIYLEHARCLARAGQGKQAIHLLEQGLKHSGPIPSLQLYALDLEVSLGAFDSALTRLAAMETGPSMRFDLMQLRGEILLKAGRRPEARETFEFALASINNQPARMNPRLQAIRTHLRSYLQDL